MNVYSIIYIAINRFVKEKTCWPRWVSKETKLLTNKKKVAHKHFKQTNSKIDYMHFYELRKNCKDAMLNDRQSNIKIVEFDIVNDNKYFWNYVRDRV